jgi:outer membrane biosynthesis protein TonB
MGRIAMVALAGLAACAAPAPPVKPPPAPEAPAFVAAPPPVVPTPAQPVTLDDYKRRLAGRIVASSSKTFHEPLPRAMKSIVVLHIQVDSRGLPLRIAVFRSNGYRSLEQRAVASVVDAVPLPPPPGALLDDTSSLSFLETFLFRDDGLFQVRSLVGETWQASEAKQ